MFAQIIFRLILVVLIGCSSLQSSCFPPIAAINTTWLPNLGPSTWQGYNSVVLMLAQGYCLNKGYIKPINIPILSELLPQVLHPLVVEYLGWDLASRHERLYPKDRVQSIVLFEDRVSQLFQDDAVNFGDFFAAFERENKKFWEQTSSIQLLSRCLKDLADLGDDYEVSPYQFTKGQIAEHFCNICGENREFIMPGEKSSMIVLDEGVIVGRERTYVDSAEFLDRMMKKTMIECSCINNCKKEAKPALLRETFIEAPSLLLLCLEKKPCIDVKVSKYVEVYQRLGRAAVKYELYGARFVNKYDTGDEGFNSTNTHLKGSFNRWYLYWGAKRIALHNPFNERDELVSYEGFDADYYRESFSYRTLVSSYPQLMLYKRE